MTPSRYRRAPRGLTLLEIMIAMFIFLVGIVGVLAAMPTGINSATWIVFQDAAIHLAHSKFAEFRRDRVDPATALNPSAGGYLPSGSGSYTPGNQEPINSSGAPWRDFASAPGQTYQYFDDITRYEWRVDTADVDNGAGGTPAAPPNYFFPKTAPGGGGGSLNLKLVSITIRMKNTTREMRFSQYMYSYGAL
jgi:prepilin-type N-terminal cleavage/methylation domain-containing protein